MSGNSPTVQAGVKPLRSRRWAPNSIETPNPTVVSGSVTSPSHNEGSGGGGGGGRPPLHNHANTGRPTTPTVNTEPHPRRYGAAGTGARTPPNSRGRPGGHVSFSPASSQANATTSRTPTGSSTSRSPRTPGRGHRGSVLSMRARKPPAVPTVESAMFSWTHNPMNSSLKRLRRDEDVLMNTVEAIPVRDLLQASFKQYRDTAVKNACFFAVFFGLFLLMTFQVYNIHIAFSTDDAVIDLFLDEEMDDYNFKFNFGEVMNQEELWQWMRGPLANGLYPTELYNGDPVPEGQQGYLANYLRFVGGARLRQLRVRNDSCFERRFTGLQATHGNQTRGRYDTKDGSCYADFSTTTMDTRPFGPNGMYTWTDGLFGLSGLAGYGPDYGTGGYVVYLPTDADNGTAIIDELFMNKWTDQGTRAVVIEFNLYNTNTRLLTVTRFLFEFMETGHVVKSAKVFTLKPVVYAAKADWVRLGSEVLYAIMFVIYIKNLVIRIRWSKSVFEHFSSATVLFDWLLACTNAMFIFNWIFFVFSRQRLDFDVNVEKFVEYYPLAQRFVYTFSWAGFLGLAGFLKGFQYMGISKNMNALWMTLARAGPDLLTFLVGFVVVVMGFAYTANLVFGNWLPEYHKFLTSFNTLLRVPLGDFDYPALARARPAVAPAFFLLYVTMVAMIILNMFIGIITKYFEEVHDELKHRDRWKTSTMSWEAETWISFKSRCMKNRICWGRRRRAVDSKERKRELENVLAFLDRQKHFLKAIEECANLGRRNHGHELYVYFDKVYGDTHEENAYVRVQELCTLVEKVPCVNHTRCAAKRAILAFNKLKMVLLVNNSLAYRPIATDAGTTYQTFEVQKFNNSGMLRKRIFSVSGERGMLLNFNPHMVLIKRLPLTQLVQINVDANDARRLGLAFSAIDMTADDEERCGKGGMETTYDVIFEDGINRAMFIEQVLEAHATLSGEDPAEAAQWMRGEGHEERISARRKSKASERESLMRFINRGSDKRLVDNSDDASSDGGSAGAGAGAGAAVADDPDAAAGSGAEGPVTAQSAAKMQAVAAARDRAASMTSVLAKLTMMEGLLPAELSILASMQQDLRRAKHLLRQSSIADARRAKRRSVSTTAVNAASKRSPKLKGMI